MLEICCYGSLTSLPAEIGQLINLQKLAIYFCEDIPSLPAEIGQLINLQTLKVTECRSLTYTSPLILFKEFSPQCSITFERYDAAPMKELEQGYEISNLTQKEDLYVQFTCHPWTESMFQMVKSIMTSLIISN